MKKIQYVKLVGLLTILLFLNISCKDDDTLLRGSGIYGAQYKMWHGQNVGRST